MLAKQFRLKKSSAFQATYRVKNSYERSGIILFVGKIKNEKQKDSLTKVGFVVSKKAHKRAVKRNRVKRQLREAYRMHKHQLLQILTDKQQQLAIAFIYLSDELTSSAEIEEKMKTLLARISERLV